jgi:hypothetical protein
MGLSRHRDGADIPRALHVTVVTRTPLVLL